MTKRFVTAELSGGPTGKNQKLVIDGVEQKGVTAVNVNIDVNDIARLTVTRIAEISAVLTEGGVDDVWDLRLMQRKTVFVEGQGETVAYEPLAAVKADTISQGLTDLAIQLKREGR